MIPEAAALELRVQALEDRVAEAGRLALVHAEKARDRVAKDTRSAADIAHDVHRALTAVGRALLFDDPEEETL